MRQRSTCSSPWRGTSLDSSIRRSPKSPSSAPWWSYGMGTSFQFPECGRTTPEIRISPTPPDSTTHYNSHYSSRGRGGESSGSSTYSHSRPPTLQRQDPLDDPCFTLPYATLHEEENECEDGQQVITPLTESSDERRKLAFTESSQSQESQESRGSKLSQQSFDEVRLSLLTQDTKV